MKLVKPRPTLKPPAPTYVSPYAASPRSGRPPFDRTQWHARRIELLTHELATRASPDLYKVSPVLLHKLKAGLLTTEEYFEAIAAIRHGGKLYTTWTASARPALLSPRSSAPSSPRGTPLMRARPSTAYSRRTALPDETTKTARPSSAAVENHAPRHVDHALEIFRTGMVVGGGMTGLHGNAGNYRFDGSVDEVGAGDTRPVTDAELESAFDTIRQQVNNKFKNFRKAFQMLDEDRSGKVTRVEALRLLMTFNLSNIREAVINRIIDIVDRDGDGMEFDEFCVMMTQEDVLDLIHSGWTGKRSPEH